MFPGTESAGRALRLSCPVRLYQGAAGMQSLF